MMEHSHRLPDPYPRAPSRLCTQSRLMDYFTSPLYIEGSNGLRDWNSYKNHSSDWDIVPPKLKEEPLSELYNKYRSKDTSELIKEQNEISKNNMSNSTGDLSGKNYNKRQMSKYSNKTSRIDLPLPNQEPDSNKCLAELEAQKVLSAQRTASREASIQRASADRVLSRGQSHERSVQRGVSLERPPRPPSSQRESTPHCFSRDSSLPRPFSRESSLPRPFASQKDGQRMFASQKGFSHDPPPSCIREYNEEYQPLSSSLSDVTSGLSTHVSNYISAPPAVRHDVILPSVGGETSRSRRARKQYLDTVKDVVDTQGNSMTIYGDILKDSI